MRVFRYAVGEINEKLGKAALGRGVVAENGGECRVAKGLGETLSESLAGARIVAQTAIDVRTRTVWKLNWENLPEKTADNVLEQSCGLLLNQLGYHVAQDSSNSVESFISGANIVQSVIIEENLLDDKNSHGFTELRSSFHDAEAQGDNFCSQEEVNDI
jgi:hypothetical protein